MGKSSKRDDQYRLPLDPPSNRSSDQNHPSYSQNLSSGPQDQGNSCKIFSFTSAVKKRKSEQEDEVLQRILAHSAALEW